MAPFYSQMINNINCNIVLKGSDLHDVPLAGID
jgi:hypothetical protein